jgi:hypothetical protein
MSLKTNSIEWYDSTDTSMTDSTELILRKIQASQSAMRADIAKITKATANLHAGQRSIKSTLETFIHKTIAEDVREISGIRDYMEQIDARVQAIEDQLELTPSEPSE